MSRLYPVLLCMVVIIIMAAGCTSSGNAHAPPLIAEKHTSASTTVPSVVTTALTMKPGTAVTTSSVKCSTHLQNDEANCGACGNACPKNALCRAGQCFCKLGYKAEKNRCVEAPDETRSGSGCTSGTSACPDGYCYDLSSSSANCGMCGNACPAGLSCIASTCANTATVVPATTEVTTAPTPVPGITSIYGLATLKITCANLQTDCSGKCVDRMTDSSNCGTCGNVCTAPASVCCNAACINLQADDPENCGLCGMHCRYDEVCSAGHCGPKATVTVPLQYVPVFQP